MQLNGKIIGAPGWLGQLSTQFLIPAQVRNSRLVSLIPAGLCTDSMEPDVGLELMNHEIMT